MAKGFQGTQGAISSLTFQSSLKSVKVPGRQISEVKGIQGYYEVNGFRRSLKVVGFKFPIQGFQLSEGQRVSRHVGIYFSIA